MRRSYVYISSILLCDLCANFAIFAVKGFSLKTDD